MSCSGVVTALQGDPHTGIDKSLLERLTKGGSAGDLFGKEGVLAELTTAEAEAALTPRWRSVLAKCLLDRQVRGFHCADDL